MRIVSALDTALGRQSIYRVVSGVLVVWGVVAIVLSAVGQLDGTIFPVRAMLVTALVLLGASLAASELLGRLFRSRPQRESAVITALILWFLYWPTTDVARLGWLVGIAVAAQASKYLFAWRGRHLFNPAAVGVLLAAILTWLLDHPIAAPYTSWWIASEPLLPWVVLGSVVILWRVRRFAHSLAFIGVATALGWWAYTDLGSTSGDALKAALVSSPVIFLGCVMLTEPLTLGSRRWQQIIAALAAAVVFTLPLLAIATGYELHTEPIGSTQELALIVANLVAFAFGQRGVRLDYAGRRDLGGSTVEVAFRPSHPVRFAPGQYVELDLAASGASGDARGLRRMLSISSPPGADLTVAVRVPERPSAFKQALLGLGPGDQVRATVVAGDFVLPRGDRPVVLVAGGIGVTPYLSQLRAQRSPSDAVLVYALPDAEVPYRDELVAAGVPVVLVSPQPPADLPAGWRHVAAPVVSADLLREAVPDLASRRMLISGPPAMVDALRVSFPRARTDHFAGY